ncbi:MAG: DegT/DnrJ/EryC1/StrS family aminotransferase [Sedimenticola sp.]
MMKIPFLDLKRQLKGALRKEIDGAIAEVLDSGSLVGGRYLQAFEQEFASYCGTLHAAGTGNGMDALYLALLALEIGSGDEVIVPAHTFIATWLAVSRTGATPVAVDVRADTGSIDERLIEQAVTEKTKAIIVVHLYGFIPDMQAIAAIAQQCGLYLIEDAAQSHGALYRGQRAGSLGTIAAFSFYPTKNLGALGDGGMVTTNDDKLIEKIYVLRDYGRSSRSEHIERGVNSRLDPLQANILRRKLHHLDHTNSRRKEIAGRYHQALEVLQHPGIRPLIGIGKNSVWHHFVVIVENRQAFIEKMSAAGIGTDIHYPVPPFRQPCYAKEIPRLDGWPVTDGLAAKVVSLPISDYLDDEEVGYICQRLKECKDI